MKAEIDQFGFLVLTPDSPTEEWALKQFMEKNTFDQPCSSNEPVILAKNIEVMKFED